MGNTNNELRNVLTEHSKNYRNINPMIMDCYTGLMPNSLPKISFVIFNFLLNNKRYYSEDSKYFNKEENSRIYTNLVLNPKDIVKRCNPAKKYENESDFESDASNLVRKLNDLHDMNIFYVWKIGYPNIYMFIMERDIGAWKYYNPSGVVTPKTLLKILNSYNGMISAMNSMLSSQNQTVSMEKIKNSYCNFVEKMVSKMHQDVSKEIKPWDELSCSIDEYVKEVIQIVRRMEQYEGMVEDDIFIESLPPNVAEKLIGKSGNNRKYSELLEDELSPKEENIVKIKPIKEKVEKPVKEKKNVLVLPESVKAEVHNVGTLNPFLNALSFVKFYRGLLRTKNADVTFFDNSAMQSETKIATEILDMLIMNNREI